MKISKKVRNISIAILIFISIIGSMVFAIYSATKQVEAELSSKGTQTKGAPAISTNDVLGKSIDGVIVVPEDSPIAQQSVERQEQGRKDAVNQGTSYISKTRVIPDNADSENNPKEDEGVSKNTSVPVAQEVNELGEELLTNKGDAMVEDESQKVTNKTTGDVVVLPLPAQESDSSTSQVEDLKLELANSTAGKKAADIKSPSNNRQAEIEQERAIARAEMINNGARSLFSGLPYAPDSGSKFKVEYKPGTNVYASTTSTVFSAKDAKMPSTSALYRSDGGQTLPGVHPNYIKALELAENAKQKLRLDGKNQTEELMPQDEPVLFDAAEIVAAKTTLPIDSDVPGPLRVEILTGRAKKAIAFGKFELIEQAPGVALTITSVIRDGEAIPAKAWALSPDTEKALFDDDVDHHYIQRFGGLFAGLFASGFLESLTNTDVTVSNGDTNISTGAIEGTTEKVVYSLATAAEGFLPILYDYANRPVQVKVPKGQIMYLLFENKVLETDRINSNAENVPQTTVQNPQEQANNASAKPLDVPSVNNKVVTARNISDEENTELWK
ncbi:DotG/IcmE/VirB10 family protein [Vibrio splendidus]|uniref:DotG/IcmE/VirB10 family protein n=1 Tax=Vibrio splendidus TaxID=29497 RepID=UPI003D117416